MDCKINEGLTSISNPANYIKQCFLFWKYFALSMNSAVYLSMIRTQPCWEHIGMFSWRHSWQHYCTSTVELSWAQKEHIPGGFIFFITSWPHIPIFVFCLLDHSHSCFFFLVGFLYLFCFSLLPFSFCY